LAERFNATGLRVAGVAAESMAARAGMHVDDVLMRIGRSAITDADALAAALRAARGSAEIELEFARASHRMIERVEVVERPREQVSGAVVHYETIASGSTLLRTIVTRPERDDRTRTAHPAVLFLQGLSDDSIDFGATADTPNARLVHGWAQAGFVTMRMERRGLGDSEGAPFEQTAYHQEVADYRAALDALAQLPFVDPRAIVLFGHSVGGMTAALLAQRHTAIDDANVGARGAATTSTVCGAMLYGTSALPWFDCLEASSRRQLALRGASADVIARVVARELTALGVSTVERRSAQYHRELHEAEIARSWREAACPALVLHGELDWVVGRAEQQQLAALIDTVPIDTVPIDTAPIDAALPGRATLRVLAGLDHAMTRHADLAASLAAYGEGAPDSAVLDATLAWMQRALGLRARPYRAR